MNQDVIDLYDRFTHGGMSRRAFMERLARLAGSTAAAVTFAAALSSDYAKAATIAPDDARLSTGSTTYPGPDGPVRTYVAHPKQGAKWPVVLVVHQNRGLNPHIEDVARRLALEGFLACAPDLLSFRGGTPADDDKAREMFQSFGSDQGAAQLAPAVAFFARHDQSTGAVGAVGFCWGGGTVDRLALAATDLKAGVAYYGPEPDTANVKSVRAAMMLHYAGLDTRITERGPAFADALKAAGAPEVQMFVYDGVNHSFNDDTAGPRYDKPAADLAWSRTVAFLKKYLGDANSG